jgi:hypothetical protein
MSAETIADPTLLARVPFGADWRGAVLPPDGSACDPLDAGTRMAMYRLLVERASPRGGFGPGAHLSPFWGYASQLAWQQRSGRLGTAGVNAIDPASWWGACNYSLSVVPYLAAMQVGAVPRLAFPAPAPHYAAALASWRDACGAIAALAPGDDLEPVRFAVWRAHLESIQTAVRAHRDAFAAMPRAEQRFARGWVRMVDLFGACAMRTDLEKLAAVAGGTLPPRVLADDAPEALADLSRHERSTVRRVFALADRPGWRWRVELAAWRRVMRARAARDESEVILGGLLGRGRETWPIRLRALRYAARPSAR